MTGIVSTISFESLNILAVDDEPFNLEILSEWMTDQGVAVDSAENGNHALDVLQAAQQPYDAILLDRMMPEMDGFEFLAAADAHGMLQSTPVIMQSAAATVDEVQAALDAGIWYYLSKPFGQRELLSVIETAVCDFRTHSQLRQIAVETPAAHMGDQGHIQTLEQAWETALRLAALSSQPGNTAVGLFELLLNAIEHGNLEISYSEKSRLRKERRWQEEVESRLRRAPYSDRLVRVAVIEMDGGIEYVISDEGKGFKSKQYLQLQTHRAADNHGRGIAFAAHSFAHLEYQGVGNQVLALATGSDA